MSLPPSAVTVLGVLAQRGPLTHKDLLAAAHLPPRTVRYALARLREAGRLVERHSLRDARQSYYLAAPGVTSAAAHQDAPLARA